MPCQDPCLFLFLFLLLAGGIVILTKADRTFKLLKHHNAWSVIYFAACYAYPKRNAVDGVASMPQLRVHVMNEKYSLTMSE
ncbi:hypothetical protein CUMW_044030 [Citrus unshiu]|nr:hypothetical protein CUMW_044030 [Citrus unshiu]GAY39396.1 hypothetical protein CUMW_044030 [Citrus unshiu]GAY39397.1 hypothetical protein CUMW_044030 [Citrus unshiu]